MTAADAEPASATRTLRGRAFYESIGSPRTVVAPMVDQSELAWRLLSRRHSPANTLCYTPMFHSRLFATNPQYRSQAYHSPILDGDPGSDRPTFVQFCSNDPKDLLSAARHVQAYCDAVDLNLGCPQGIARKGHYGAFLQEDWGLIRSLIRTLADELDVPVTAKIRILGSKERSLEYARMVVDAGASVLTVHGRTREQKGHNTGLADWSVIKYIRDNLPREIVMFANGNILWQEDVARCLATTGVDGVMSAEGNLYNPAVFQTDPDWDKRFPRMDMMGREYLDIVRMHILPHLPLQDLNNPDATKRTKKMMNEILGDPSLGAIRPHLFKLWHTLLPKHTHIRDLLARASCKHQESFTDPLAKFDHLLQEVTKVVEAELAAHPEEVDAEGKWVGPDIGFQEGDAVEPPGIVVEVGEPPRKVVRRVPWYRCQPYYRPLPEEAAAKGALKIKGQGEESKTKARKADDGLAQEQTKKVRTSDGDVAEVVEKDYIMGEKIDGSPIEAAKVAESK